MDLNELIARQHILALLNRYARGVDRHDWPLVRACYHPDAHDDHGLYSGGVEGLMVFLAQTAARFTSTTHQLGNHLAQINGDTARAETSCLTWYRLPARGDGTLRSLAQGVRYLDHFSLREGCWAIARRSVVLDWEHVFDAARAPPVAAGWQVGAHGESDPSAHFFDPAPSTRNPAA